MKLYHNQSKNNPTAKTGKPIVIQRGTAKTLCQIKFKKLNAVVLKVAPICAPIFDVYIFSPCNPFIYTSYI